MSGSAARLLQTHEVSFQIFYGFGDNSQVVEHTVMLLDASKGLVLGVLEVQSGSPVDALVRLDVDLAAGRLLGVVVVGGGRHGIGTDEGVDVCAQLAGVEDGIQALDRDGRLNPLLSEIVAMVVDGAPVDGAGDGGQAGEDSGGRDLVGEHFECGSCEEDEKRLQGWV